MASLDSYLVSIGIKGQAAVLSQMAKIRNEGKKLTGKKTAVELTPSKQPSPSSAPPNAPTPQQQTEASKLAKENEKTTENFKKGTKVFSESMNGVASVGNAMASLDPTSAIQGISSAAGQAMSFIPAIGAIFPAIAQATNAMISMARNSAEMSKQSIAAYNRLAGRNAATAFYKGGLEQSGQMSNADMAGFVQQISRSMGKIQTPLANEINKLMGSKDTGALASAASGNWESTGTDKGWILQQISNGMQGLPPSVKQALSASMLKNNASEIQGYAPGQYSAQANAAKFENAGEAQTKALYVKATENMDTLTDLNDKLNGLQVTMLSAGLGMASVLDTAISKFDGMVDGIKEVNAAVDAYNASSKGAVDKLTLARRLGQ